MQNCWQGSGLTFQTLGLQRVAVRQFSVGKPAQSGGRRQMAKRLDMIPE